MVNFYYKEDEKNHFTVYMNDCILKVCDSYEKALAIYLKLLDMGCDVEMKGEWAEPKE